MSDTNNFCFMEVSVHVFKLQYLIKPRSKWMHCMLNWYQKQVFLQNYWPKRTYGTSAKLAYKNPV